MIFLDMDGVLCDFASAAFRVHDREFNADEYPKGQFALEPVLGVTTKQFWDRIDSHGEAFWEQLEPLPWALELVTAVSMLDTVIIATSPSRSPASYSGKRRWLQRMGLHVLASMFGSEKWLLAQPGRTLIDDAEHNVFPWCRQGGDAILVPQPWNHGQPVPDMADFVMRCLEQITSSRKEYA